MTNNEPTDERINWLIDYVTNDAEIPFYAGEDIAQALRELQERRKADSAEPVSFDALNAAVAEVTGCSMRAWDENFYKGHQSVPFMNYNSLARIVDKFRASPQQAPDREGAK